MTTLILSIFFSISASADVVEVDGIYYDISETTATVTYGKKEYSGDIVIPESITYENSKYSVTSIGDWAFSYCTGLTSITIPNSVTSIGNYAFWDCYGLTSVTIPNSVTSIVDYVFSYCTGLTSITIPNSVTSIGDGAFSGCSGLTSITIPNSVTSIGELAFDECSGLTSITIPNSVTSIGDYVLNRCDGIKNTIIVNDMFVYLPKTYTGHYSIPENITKIIGGAFEDCSGLTSVTIPNSVTSIGGHAFFYCSGLTSVTIPNSVTSIGDWAFDCCDNLKNVYCYSEEVPSTNVWIFDGTYIENATLHVPASAIEAYKTTAPWSGFGTIKAIEETVGIESVEARGIAIQSTGGFITISGLDNNEEVSFYCIDGKSLGSATAINGTTSFAAQSGSIVVAKIGKENIKIAVK